MLNSLGSQSNCTVKDSFCLWSNPCGASHGGHHTGGKAEPSLWLEMPLVPAALQHCWWSTPLKAQPSSQLRFCPSFPGLQHPLSSTEMPDTVGSFPPHQRTCQFYSLFLGLLPRASQQDYRKLPSKLSLFKWFLTRWPQSHISDIHLHSLAMTTVIELKGFTVSN